MMAKRYSVSREVGDFPDRGHRLRSTESRLGTVRGLHGGRWRRFQQ